jgi:DNA replication and repair protein RecF
VYIKSLELIDYRNYERQSAEFCAGANILCGKNGMGKTNLLEAIAVSSIGRSPRTPRDKELIRRGQTAAKIKLAAEKDAGEDSVEIIISKSENKRIRVNLMPLSRIGELMGTVSVVFFSPNELKIVQSSPVERRSFIDIALCQLSKNYFYLLSRYEKILRHRNSLLKSGTATDDILDIWDAQLAETGGKVIKTRRGFITKLAPLAKENHLFLSGGKEELIITYEGIPGDDPENVSSRFLSILKKERAQDIKTGFTHTGPHKDDIILSVDSLDVRSFGSQGQQRTAALSLKLAELELAKITSGESPVLLLDDVLSELDLSRQEKLLSKIAGFQTFITCTHISEELKASFPSPVKTYTVENGTITGISDKIRSVR